MKSLKTTLAILTITFLLISCSKDDDKPAPIVYPEENFWQGFISNAGFNGITASNIDKDLLCVFSPKVKGKINSLVVKIPAAGSVEIRIWDITTNETVTLFSEIFNVPTANTDYVKTIAPIVLNKDGKFLISMYCQSQFQYQRTSTLVPVNSGNITINHFGVYDGRLFTFSDYNPGFNSISIDNTIGGNISFNFQQIE